MCVCIYKCICTHTYKYYKSGSRHTITGQISTIKLLAIACTAASLAHWASSLPLALSCCELLHRRATLRENDQSTGNTDAALQEVSPWIQPCSCCFTKKKTQQLIIRWQNGTNQQEFWDEPSAARYCQDPDRASFSWRWFKKVCRHAHFISCSAVILKTLLGLILSPRLIMTYDFRHCSWSTN